MKEKIKAFFAVALPLLAVIGLLVAIGWGLYSALSKQRQIAKREAFKETYRDAIQFCSKEHPGNMLAFISCVDETTDIIPQDIKDECIKEVLK